MAKKADAKKPAARKAVATKKTDAHVCEPTAAHPECARVGKGKGVPAEGGAQ